MKHPLHLPIKNQFLNKLASRVTGLAYLTQLYDSWLASPERKSIAKEPQSGGAALLDFGLRFLDVSVNWHQPDRLSAIPAKGPLVVVANHPLGGLEGMLLAHELLKTRPDVKVLTNELLLKFPEFEGLFIGVDVLGKNKARANARGIRAASKHLANGGALLVFPAGTVAGIDLKSWKISDAPWNDIAGHLVRKYQCACVPFYIDARNSYPFYLVGRVSRLLRTGLLPREMGAKEHARINIHVGEPIAWRDVASFSSSKEITDYLRLCSDLLLSPDEIYEEPAGSEQLVLNDIEDTLILDQLSALEKFRVLEKGGFSVYCAPYAEMGCVMEQIAICREKTFRAVNEGTGAELDSDRFDPFYWHLWVWDDAKKKLVGGYRLGKVDEIIDRHGIEKLYTNSLYHYEPQFAEKLDGSVEVGRSFVSLDYQRHSKVLDLLWRGIGAFMVANPGYHTLFGCVSVSKEYSGLARAFLAESLLKHFTAKPEFTKGVKPKKPLTVGDKPWTDNMLEAVSNIPIINKLLGRIDVGKTIPILIRHYLSLSGRFVSFTVNTDFNHSLDGLIVVDLRATPEKYLRRYLGAEGAADFLKRNSALESVA